jgi:antitoxin component YwqK of YwqJK toxin-antitoxin module
MDPVNFGPNEQPNNNRIEETIAIIDKVTELRQGCCKTFINGRINKSGFYVNDVKEGDFVYYDWQRKPMTTKRYVAGTLTRVTNHYDNTTVDYQPGSNLTTRYHPDGSIACTFTRIVDGALGADHTQMDAPTKDKLRGTLKHGVEEHRDITGNITLQVCWDHGLRHGLTRSFKDGEPNGHETYDRGVLHGEFMSYHPNGTIDTESYYVTGRLHGPFKAHYPNGNLKSFGTYDDGHQHDMLHYYEDGAVRAITRTDATGCTTCKTFYPNGKPLIAEQYLNHLLDGPRIVYHANGKPSIKSHYTAGMKNGLYEVFSETDTPMSITTYDNNVPVGERKVFHPDGSLKVVEHYVDGKLHGLRETFGYGVLMTSTMFEHGFQVKKE